MACATFRSRVDKVVAYMRDEKYGYMLRWIDVITDVAQSQQQRFPDTETKEHVLRTYEEARARYEQVIVDAVSHEAK